MTASIPPLVTIESLRSALPGTSGPDFASTDRKPGPRSPTSSPLRSLPPRSLLATLLLVLVVLLPHPAQAVAVTFDNCLPTSYKDHTPQPLQWVPLYVDAVFDTENESHGLRVTAWGNVTGSVEGVDLPAAGHSDWSDTSVTRGKIIREPEPNNADPRATTLIRRVNVLTYEPYNKLADFCNDALENGVCPLGPVFETTALDPRDSLPQFTLSHEFFDSYAFTTFAVTFIIIYGDQARTNLGCLSVPVTPDLGNIEWLLTFLPLIVLLFVGFATVLAAVYSPWGTTDIFMWTSNHGRDVDLLRLVTPGFGDCLQYIQFAALTGGLSLRYPGFYQPVMSQVAWSSLMFNETLVSKATPWQSVVDGIYVTNSTRGLGRYSQLVGLGEVEDVWPGMMVWLLVIIGGVLVLTQLGFLLQWLYRYIRTIPEEDLRSKNLPFSLGNIVRITFNLFLLPIVSLSTFQLVVAGDSPAYSVGLAAVTLAAILGFVGWLLHVITRARPRSELFDDLSAVLIYGPLYNTYTDEAAGFAVVPIILGILRGIAIGGLQSSGTAQIAILATAEIIQLLTLIYFRPFHRETSMNAYHSLFSVLRLVTILLMIAFAPSLGLVEAPRGWIGYTILLIHACVMVFGFFLNAIQTIIEVVARLLGAGADDHLGLTRGGLSKILGMRQLSRRMSRRHHGPSRHSQLSTAAMLDTDRTSKQGYAMPSGRVRSESVASLGALMNKHQRSSSAVDSLDMYPGAPGRSFTPTTPGEASQFSFLPSPTSASRPQAAMTAADAADPYYRPPRRRRGTVTDSVASYNRVSIADSARLSQGPGGLAGDAGDIGAGLSQGATPAPHGLTAPPSLGPRTDYSTRESDFYYGVRGPALNSERAGRKLGTGPADPTGPVATAQSWFAGLFSGGKSKEKGKGFEVVRSARMPQAMKVPEPPEGVPVAMSTLRNGPIESEEDDDEQDTPAKRKKKGPPKSPALLDERGEPGEDIDAEESRFDLEVPDIPRKSSKRNSGTDLSLAPSFNLVPPGSPPAPRSDDAAPRLSRLPFERTDSLKHQSSLSSLDIGDGLTPMDLHRMKTSEDRPTSGVVPRRGVSQVELDRQVDLLGSSAEVLDAQYASSHNSAEGKR
ncbi:related to integral membrane protein [Cephalotrichum gorgonifer]|uniref:Related to integral membrane protein n=1 Tax=Cephalotrichum gorgonifer TaxID=2041049 RepID=A0AAE8SR16_9PEZI|nr:related to integral membrane protein [Cephalotrichum gorgonifer]